MENIYNQLPLGPAKNEQEERKKLAKTEVLTTSRTVF